MINYITNPIDVRTNQSSGTISTNTHRSIFSKLMISGITIGLILFVSFIVTKSSTALYVETISFEPKVDYATGNWSWGVAIGDLNGDDSRDIAIANHNSSNVSVLLNNGNGTFGSKADYSTGNGAASVVIADFNGDNNLDLAVSNRNANTVSVLMNNGNGTFTAKVDYTTATTPWSVASGDFNGDGKPDLATANANATSSVFINNGNGTFAAKVDYPLSNSGGNSIAVGDLNADGNADIVTGNGVYTNGDISVLISKGDGTFYSHFDYESGGYPVSVAIGDLNNDGKPDIATANYYSGNPGKASVFINNGDGTFAQNIDYPITVGATSVAISDFNGDDLADMAFSVRTSSLIDVLTNNGDNTFSSSGTFSAGTYSRAIAADDLNGDGKNDLVTANELGSSMSILFNNTTYPTPTPIPPVYKSCGQACAGHDDCATGFCTLGICRNTNCSSDTDCICENDFCMFYGQTMSATTKIPSATIRGSIHLTEGGVCSGAITTATSASVNIRQTGPNECLTVDPWTMLGYTNSAISDPLQPTGYGYVFDDLDCFDLVTRKANYQINISNTAEPTKMFCGGNQAAMVYNIEVTSGEDRVIETKLVPPDNAWLQTKGIGDVYANGNIEINIPSTAQLNSFILPNSISGSGIAVARGVIDIGSGNLSNTAWAMPNYQVNLPARSTFDELYRKYVTGGLVSETLSDEKLSAPNSKSGEAGGSLEEIVVDPGGGKGDPITKPSTHVIHATSDKVTITDEWSQIDIPVVVIAEGELTISANITLGPNGFVMFITRGSIYVANNVGTWATPPRGGGTVPPQLEGVFIAGENFHLIGTNDPSTDYFIYISGSIVTGAVNNGIGNFISERSTWVNDTLPTENISFNPKLIINAPREISNPIYTWKETK